MLAFGPVAGQLESDSSLVCSGAIIAANKVPGVRVALVYDAETAQGVRVWNHANVLALSSTPPLSRLCARLWTPGSKPPPPRVKLRVPGTIEKYIASSD